VADPITRLREVAESLEQFTRELQRLTSAVYLLAENLEAGRAARGEPSPTPDFSSAPKEPPPF
jgi:hypothetical protein